MSQGAARKVDAALSLPPGDGAALVLPARSLRHFKMAGPGWQRDDLFEMRDPKPGEDYGQGETLLLFGDVLGTGTVANER